MCVRGKRANHVELDAIRTRYWIRITTIVFSQPDTFTHRTRYHPHRLSCLKTLVLYQRFVVSSIICKNIPRLLLNWFPRNTHFIVLPRRSNVNDTRHTHTRVHYPCFYYVSISLHPGLKIYESIAKHQQHMQHLHNGTHTKNLHINTRTFSHTKQIVNVVCWYDFFVYK